MVPRPYISCSGFWPLWVVNATRVTPLPSNGTLMGSNGLTVRLGNRLRCLFILIDSIPPSGVVNPFTRQRTIVKVTSSETSVCLSALSVLFFFFWFIIHWIALDKAMNKKREYFILLFKIYKGTLMELSSKVSNKIGHE